MDSRVRFLNSEVKRLDPKFFVKRTQDGTIFIAKREAFALKSPVSICFALTNDWTLKGIPRDIGVVPILHRLKFGDDPYKAFAEMDRQAEEEENSRKSAAASSALETADRMHFDARKNWSQINTSCMDKKGVTRHGHY